MVCSFTFSFNASAYGTACAETSHGDAERVDVARLTYAALPARRAQSSGAMYGSVPTTNCLKKPPLGWPTGATPVLIASGLGRVEVGEDARAALVDEDVVRLRVAVQHAARVQVRDRGGDVAGERRHRRRREPLA